MACYRRNNYKFEDKLVRPIKIIFLLFSSVVSCYQLELLCFISWVHVGCEVGLRKKLWQTSTRIRVIFLNNFLFSLITFYRLCIWRKKIFTLISTIHDHSISPHGSVKWLFIVGLLIRRTCLSHNWVLTDHS